MTSKAPRHPLRPTVRKLMLAAGIVYKSKLAETAILDRMDKDLDLLARAAYLNSLGIVRPKAVLRASKDLKIGNYNVVRDLFKKSQKRRRSSEKKETEE